MKLNLGCGFDKREGFINADNFPECEPDVFVDIQSTPWPFADNQFDFILMKHVLEHVGATVDGFAQVMRELYRVTAPDGIIEIHVPHFRHDSYWSDPTHVRAFTVLTFEMMSKARNDQWIAARANYTMLAYMLKVDFEVVEARQIYDAYWTKREQAGEFTREQLRRMAEEKWGVVRELQVTLRAVKPTERVLGPEG
jgi:predicted SAM-dependent methyltransferase